MTAVVLGVVSAHAHSAPGRAHVPRNVIPVRTDDGFSRRPSYVHVAPSCGAPALTLTTQSETPVKIEDNGSQVNNRH